MLQAWAWQSAAITNNTLVATSGGLVTDIVVAQAGTVLPPWNWDRIIAFTMQATFP
jgi:hypothetical protein